VTTLAGTALALMLSWWQPSPRVEIVAWSLYYGVNPNLALAVQDTETGDLTEADGTRDRALWKGNFGRFQVNCTTWRATFGIRACSELFDVHANIRAGVAVLAYVRTHYAWGERYCRCGGAHHWVAHYCGGTRVDEAAQKYARSAVRRMRIKEIEARARFGGQS
jgi:hypothetical protein